MAESILWYDLETFGVDPAYDRVAQFAAIRTDPELRELDDGHMLFCRPTPDYLPDPKSCLLTGIGPERCLADGLPEYAFFSRVNALLSQPGTCGAGYNSIRFDDEFVRYGLYRNLYDPYRREYQDGNTRWDLLDVMRAAADLRPEGLVWPRDAEGRPSFRLEALSQANGIEHSHAHDALADVRATIALARLLRARQPRFFDWAWRQRSKEAVKRQVNLHKRLPFVHVSGMLGGPRGHTSLMAPIVTMPGNPNCILCYDLRYDPAELLALDPAAVRRRIFTKSDELSEAGLERIHIKGVHLNRSPFVAPPRILEEDGAAERLGIDLAACRAHWQALRGEALLAQKLIKVYEREQRPADADPDFSLYAGFATDRDRTFLDAAHYEADQERPAAESAAALLELARRLQFDDRKYNELLRRFAARNWPGALPDDEAKRWKSFCASRLLMPPGDRLVNLDFYRRKVAEHMADTQLPAPGKLVLRDLADWAARLDREILAWPGP